MTEVAVENLAFTLGRKADIDEVLRQAGLTRQRLSVLMVDDEIAQAMETRLMQFSMRRGDLLKIMGSKRFF
jgi:hypothetical protein